ncbi:hypothetical protein M758_12G182200 [Ceratodon purpureus]|nr:hypothetical protein M758_12G182200 [Ceratodon purpureus]KAG0599838.1 hypothetical protein M758_12G182200 [Ceratodon purpureus]KAG0599839.1 hypothetical protein M758_12G182200 [Ceratodon purpureus]KAG0599840.1 hypothetical protein M758_12G182200 [Ceratodon purpureus]
MEGGCDDYLEVHNVEKLKDGRRFLYVVKVFKGANIPLRFLQSQWPRGMLSAGHSRDGPLVSIIGGTLLKDKRLENKFAFVMSRRKGDLRRLIDARMVENGNKCAPFSEVQTKWLMYKIAKDMSQLHEEYGILHKDLKAANVLLSLLEDDKVLGIGDEVCVVVADFECSMGVVGTGFWRAPEILRQLKNRGLSSKVEFTPQADVYCYGMTCYEIVTGCIPFGDQSFNKYDLVLSGRRPELPRGLDPFIKEIIVSCWKDDPLLRPSFQEIVKKLHSRLYENEDIYP